MVSRSRQACQLPFSRSSLWTPRTLRPSPLRWKGRQAAAICTHWIESSGPRLVSVIGSSIILRLRKLGHCDICSECNHALVCSCTSGVIRGFSLAHVEPPRSRLFILRTRAVAARSGPRQYLNALRWISCKSLSSIFQGCLKVVAASAKIPS